MNQKEFAKELNSWKGELIEEIIPYYKGGDKDRGDQAFRRWKERFLRFLKIYAPLEADRLESETRHIAYAIKRGEHRLDEFMRVDGKKCLAFIDDLAYSAEKGRIIEFKEEGDVQIETVSSGISATGKQAYYVDPSRLEELRTLKSPKYDLSKLVRLCEELNTTSNDECYYSIAMLIRAILDHVPPLFGYKSFAELANNYKAGGQSFKRCMQHLENSSRRIADSHLHTQIRKNESLPNRTQVNFSSDLDMLLGEVVRVLK